MSNFEPLRTPDPWPPPDEPPLTEREVKWRRVPLFGGVVAYFLRDKDQWDHFHAVLTSIESDIDEQLNARTDFDVYLGDSMSQEIVGLLADTVAHEKPIDPPALHPDDLYELLVWGGFDDLTSLLCSMAFDDRFGVNLPLGDFVMFLE